MKWRPSWAVLASVVVLSSFFFSQIASATCQAPANAIEAENCLPGTPDSQWQISGSGDQEIQGFATDISVNKGETISFKVETASTDYRIDIYRLGYYQGNGARLVASVLPSVPLPQVQPFCLSEPSSGLIDCGNWAVSASWNVPTDATSGIYIAKLVTQDSGPYSSHMVFVVRDDNGGSALLVQTSDTTWQAYNDYGGNSLYEGQPAGRAYKVSYNRPFDSRAETPEDWVFNAEYPLVRWLERNGYDVSYTTGIDTDRRGAELLEHQVFISVGHDEYWSGNQRANVEAARDAGVSLAFLSGNEVFWKTRLGPSIDGTNTPNRTIICYKETHAGSNIGDPDWTGTWRDNRPFNPEGSYPENALTGTMFMVNSNLGNAGTSETAIAVPAADGKMRFWRNTSVANLTGNQVATLAIDTIGYEWDMDIDNGYRPDGLIRLSSKTLNNVEVLQNQGSKYDPGTATHNLTLYRAANGPGPEDDALVFGAGTIQWVWGLDSNHDRGNNPEDGRMQQATVNLLADMGVQPATLQVNLVAASASTDTDPPSSTVTSHENNDPIIGSATISGIAADTGGGVVGGVEVSTDNGATWHPADGRENWSYEWNSPAPGTAIIRSRATDDSGNIGAPSAAVTVNVAVPAGTFNLFLGTLTGNQGNDAQAVELGMRFRSDVPGYVTGVRFYKYSANTGTHTGRLWDNSGALLGALTFAGESASGWQEATFATPIPIVADTTYVVSYHTPSGNYAVITGGFNTSVDNAPLHGLANGFDGANGVYHYGSGGVFPTDTYQAANYLVDVVFATSVGPDTTAPLVATITPPNGSSGIAATTNVTAVFNEGMDQSTISASTFELRDNANNLVPADISYSAATRTATLNPSPVLDYSITYTARVKSGASGVKDVAGNPLANDKVWSFTTAAPPPPPPDQGPGGPILVVTTSADPFSTYFAEILRSEGYNAFLTRDISLIDANVLNAYDVVIVASMPLSLAQASMFATWADAGGNLIAINPDADLAPVLGLQGAPNSTSEGYILVNTSAAPGAGITGETMQFHGSAAHWTLAGATQVAALYSDATTSTGYPAVTIRSVGSNGGQAAAFTYDLARSVVYTRQGNPANAGIETDGVLGSTEAGTIRSSDLYYPNYLDFNKVQIPQADEQQRLLTNMIGFMNFDKKPLPKFWYFPRDKKAVVIMTGDDHANGGTAGRFEQYKLLNPGCNVANWECVRGTSYIYPNAPLTNAQAAGYTADGFEIGIHPHPSCGNFTFESLTTDFSNMLGAFAAKYTSIPAPNTNRTHCGAFSDWASAPKVELANGIRLDTNYYYWPAGWMLNRPGLFTGSGMPQRFADTDGSIIDVYQAATQMSDEWPNYVPAYPIEQSYPLHINTLLDNALGNLGYYGAFTANMHTDSPSSSGSDSIVASAQSRGVSVISSRQMLEWLDGRNGSTFDSIVWSGGNTLSFSIGAGAGANGLRAMVPTASPAGALTGVTRNGTPLTLTLRTVKGVEYAFFDAAGGNYIASYAVDTTSPTITNVVAAATTTNGTVTITWTTNEASDSLVVYGLTPAFGSQVSDLALVTSHSITLTGLAPNTTYYFRVVSKDAFNNSTTEPPTAAQFTTPESSFIDTFVLDFNGGTNVSNTYVSAAGDGEVTLAPTLGSEFLGTTLPDGWTSGTWESQGGGAGGTTSVSNGSLHANGAFLQGSTTFSPGRSIEFTATFGAATFQHVGFVEDYLTPQENAWIIFSTYNTSSTVYARTRFNGGNDVNVPLAGLLGTPHKYRIEWDATEARFYVDDQLVSTQTGTFTVPLRPVVSDFSSAGAELSVDWLHMSPYASPGRFESRVFDAGNSANWGALNWDADVPAGTTLAMSVRLSNDGVTWSEFVPVASSGSLIGGNSRYLQYRVDLTSTSANVTPVLYSVTAGYSLGPDNSAPSIVSRAPAPDAVDVGLSTNITVSFNEAMNASSFDTTKFKLRAQGAGADVPALINVSGSTATLDPTDDLLPNTLYTVTVLGSVTDSAGNPLGTDDTWTFTTGVLLSTFVDDLVANEFGAGTVSGTYVSEGYDSQTSNGEVTLLPQLAEEFSGSVLPDGWASTAWNAGGTSTVSGGSLLIDGSQAYAAPVGPGHVLEFRATFGAAMFQHAGFSDNFNNIFAIFSTNNGTSQLQARTNFGGNANVGAPGQYIGSSHLYRIEWTSSGVVFFIDGAQVAAHSGTFGSPGVMSPIGSDYDTNGPVLAIDWMRMSPYATSGTFASRVFGTAGATQDWMTLSAQTTLPADTTITFRTRSGNSSTPDGTWSEFEALSGNAIVSPNGKYLQYEATLTTSNVGVTPVLSRVEFSGTQAPPVPTYTLTYTAGANGSISGATPQTVNSGENGSAVTAVPSTGFHFAGWSDGVATATRTDSNVTANITVTANFEVNAYTLTYSAGANGSIVGVSPQTVNYADSGSAVSAVADPGYHFVDWSDGSTDNPRLDVLVQSDISVTANFAINTYTLTYTAGANGTITGASPQTVDYGASGSAVTAVPNAGYHFVSWSDGVATASRSDSNVGADLSVTANFAINTYTLTYTAGANGSVTGTSPQTVNYGESGTAVTAVPSAGYNFTGWSDGVATASRTDANVTADVSVTANFAINTYTLTYTAGANGTITGTSPQTVDHGSSGTAVTAVPAVGYSFAGWSDGVATALRTDSNVTADLNVTANFALNTYTLSYTAGANGMIAGISPQTVDHGASGTQVTAVPAVGYSFAGWSDGVATASRTDSNVIADINVTANFAINTYTLTYTAGANGTVTGTSPQTVDHGASGTAVTAVPAVGYSFAGWSDGVATALRTDSNVTADLNVTANFALNTYTLSYTAGANGMIAGISPQTVDHGASGTQVTAVPAVGYSFAGWSDGSMDNPRMDVFVQSDISVTANFALNSYTLTYTAGANGTVTGTSPQTVDHGASGTIVTAVPNVGYSFAGWSDGVATASRTDANVTADLNVTANFALNTYTLSYTASANGMIAGISPQTVDHGASGTQVTAVPAVGYSFAGWSDGSMDNPRMDVFVQSDISVTANFALNSYTLNYTAGANGTVTGTSPQTVDHGASGTAVTAVPAVGYSFAGWSDGVATASRTDSNVTADISVTANFALNSYTLTYTAGANGTVTGTSPQTVDHGGIGTAVTAVPDAGYSFAGWSDGVATASRTDSNVIADISVTANFAINTYTLTYAAVANGSITGTSPQTVDHGGSGTAVTAVPDAGYSFAGWSDGVATASRTDSNVTGDVNVTANFALNTYTLTYTAGANGTITGTSPQTVDHGSSGSAVTAVPAVGYSFAGWSDGVATASRTDSNVTADVNVTANFALNTYTLTYTAGANGTVTGTSPQTVGHGGSGTAVTAVPAVGYSFAGWSDGVATASRTDSNVTGDVNVTANFALNTYTLTYTAGANGTITGTSPQTVDHGSSGSAVKAVPAVGYSFAGWSDGVATASRTDSNVIGDVNVTANFALNTYTLTYTAVANGSITGTSPQTVDHGGSGTAVTAVPAVGYSFAGWSDGVVTASRTDSNVIADISVTANFAINTYTLTYTAGANGTVTGTSPQTVDHGASGTQVTAVPSVGYSFAGWSDGSMDNPRMDVFVQSDISVTANFALNTYTLTYTAGANGTITGTSPQTVDHGASGTIVTAVPAVGYSFAGWSDGVAAASRTDSNVIADISVTANFALNTYTLTYTAGANGSVTGTSPQTVDHGASGTAVTAVPAVGYSFAGWSDGVATALRTDSNVTADLNVTANFALNTYTLSYTAGANGMIAGISPQTVDHGASGTAVTAVPDAGYSFAGWSDGVATASRTDSNVTAALNVTANFALNTYTLSYTASANGMIAGISPQTVDHGASGTQVTAVPAVGYSFAGWSDGSMDNPRMDVFVQSDISVTANFALNSYTLTYTAGANGTVTGTSPQTVDHGASGTAVAAVPDAGYSFAGWSDGVATASRTDSNVTSDINVTANFALNTYTLTYAAGANGTISGISPQTVGHGANGSAVTAVANAGYHFVSWSDGVLTASRTDSNVTADLNVTANFALNTYTLSYTAGANGMIAGISPQTVDHGASGTQVTAVPAVGYSFAGWSDGSTDNPRLDVLVQSDISVTANFAINTYTLTYTAGANGTITGASPQTVDYGASGSAVTAVPNAGYHFVSWSDGVATASRSDSNVGADLSVTANFAINTYTLTYIAGANGSITGISPQTVTHGASGTAVTAVANAGYHFVSWSDGVATASRTDANVTADKSVIATFAITSTDVAPTITVNPANQSVTAGASVTFSAAANGQPTPTVQWQVSTNNGSTFSNIGGATSTDLTFAAALAQNGYRYRAVFTNSLGNATTTAAILTVTNPPVVDIAFRSSSKNKINSGTSLSIARPALLSAGDVMLASISSRNTANITAPAGWALVRTDALVGIGRLSTFVKVATASEPSTYAFGLGGTTAASGGIVAYSGVSTSAPIHASAGRVNSKSFIYAAPSVTTTVARTRVVSVWSLPADPNIVLPLAMAERVQVGGGSPLKTTTDIADALQTGTGPTGVRYSIGQAIVPSFAHTIALKPGN